MPPADDHRSDEQLIADLNAGDLSAFDGLFYRYRDRVLRLAHRFTGNRDDALDVLQETFAYVFSKFPGFRLTAQFTTFLYPAVRHTSLAICRKRGRTISADAQLLDLPAASGPVPSDVANVVSRLPAGQRDVVILRFVDDLSTDEIAAALGIPPGTVKSRLHNALASLRTDPRLADHFF